MILSAADLLGAWERGLEHPPFLKALTILSAAYPAARFDDILDLSIGRRDFMLFELRNEIFGPRMVCQFSCPGCNDLMELELHSKELIFEPRIEPDGLLRFSDQGYCIDFRLPSSRDLLESDRKDPDTLRLNLLKRCILRADNGSEQICIKDIPDGVLAAIEERMSEADPQADIQIAMRCPSCNEQVQGLFDIVSFFWMEIDAWANHLLEQVNILASSYGWSEKEILGLSPLRRQIYLRLVNG
jgi:hypothetical protein